MDVPDGKGNVKPFTIELTSINMLSRSGWRSGVIKAGDQVKAVVAPLLSGQPGGLLLDITLPDGRKLESPVPGASTFKRTPEAGDDHGWADDFAPRHVARSISGLRDRRSRFISAPQRNQPRRVPDAGGSCERYRGAPGARGAQAQDPYSPSPASQPPLKAS